MSIVTIFTPRDNAPWIDVSQCEETFLLRKIYQLLWGSEGFPDKSELPEVQEVVDALKEHGHMSMEDGWIAMARDEKGITNFFLDQYKEMREDRDYEDQERCKALRRAEAAEGQIKTLREALAILTQGITITHTPTKKFGE